ncbi:MAG: biotin-dependent carboxyltransferase family protein [Actinoplanes sp.]
MVGNPPDAAGLETTLMGCALRFTDARQVAVTGATATIKIDGQVVEGAVVQGQMLEGRGLEGAASVGHVSAARVSEGRALGGRVFEVPAGAVLDVGRATRGVRSYVAVAGGIAVEPTLGSRSTDTLSGLGPPKLAADMTLPLGPVPVPPGPVPSATPVDKSDGELVLGVWLGPRDDWFASGELFASSYTVSPVSNRVGTRLVGAALRRTQAGELPSEGVVLGAIQVPADGQPLIFLADHPTTGGYPVIGVVDDVTALAQARPGTKVRFRGLD